MSAAEIITVIKAINDHVTVKYSGLIIDYLTEKKKAHLLFERELFNDMDKAVQQLINNMSSLFNATRKESEAFKKIAMQCSEYNKWKQKKYDDHLLKIEQLEKGVDVFVRKAFNAKVLDQHTLFDEALSNPLNTNKIAIEEKQNKREYVNNNNLYPNNNNLLYPTIDINLFNDNTTHSTIFSNSSQNTNDVKFTHQSSEEEKTHQNEPIQPISVPQHHNHIKHIPMYFPPLPPIKINIQKISNNEENTYNNYQKLPISFSAKKFKSASNNGIMHHELNGNVTKPTNNVSSVDKRNNIVKKNKNFAWSTNKKKQMNISSQIPPPKPPPPPPLSVDCSVSELSDSSNVYSTDTTINNRKQYKCHICDKKFSVRLQWEHHQLTHKFSGKIKTKIATKTVSKSRVKKKKKKKKRNFQKMCGDDNKMNATNKSNKRSCHRYQCEYCDKQYLRQTSFIKHYNNHMITNPNMECNFCLNKFSDNGELKVHINEFGAGIAVDDGFYQCCKCNMRFERKEELSSHIGSQHKIPTCDEERNKSVEFI